VAQLVERDDVQLGAFDGPREALAQREEQVAVAS
jgi:hypothetical protein